MNIVLDSSVLVGLLVPNDVWHKPAVDVWEAIKTAQQEIVVFDCVIAETISVIARRLAEKGLQEEFGVLLDRMNERLPYEVITWVLPDVPRLYREILRLIRTSSGCLNFNDALIALVCRELGISLIASFDADFDHIPWLRRVASPQDVVSS
jgi:Predicted nucleic acid-binding protein, contains PIN domain